MTAEIEQLKLQVRRYALALDVMEDKVKRLTAERDEGARWRREGERQLRAEIERQRQHLIMRFNEAEEAAAEIKRLTAENDYLKNFLRHHGWDYGGSLPATERT
jgi:hypothetical protein